MAKLQRILLISGATIVALCGALVVHIALVTKDKGPTPHLANVQLARIDFLETLPEQEAQRLQAAISAMPGVQRAQVNLNDRNIVYAYDRTQQDQRVVFAQVDALTELSCQRLVVTAEAAASGCPAMVKGDLHDGVGQWIAQLFN
jgi:outer membrane usher protein FimD/PapC